MPATTTQLVRLRGELYRELHEFAESEHTSMQEVLASAIDMYRKQRFWEHTHAAYTALRANPEAWAQELEERAEWEATLADGLDDDVYEDERLQAPAASAPQEFAEAR